jgi:hypothetical protein
VSAASVIAETAGCHRTTSGRQPAAPRRPTPPDPRSSHDRQLSASRRPVDLDQTRTWQESFYRDVHQHPELSHQEHRTGGAVAQRLRASGYDVTEGVGGTGVIGILRNGGGPCVLLRADMDALPVKEATGLPYASTVTTTDHSGAEVSVMHACGHDAQDRRGRCRSLSPDPSHPTGALQPCPHRPGA